MSGPLKGVKVYVDVRSSDGKANYSTCVREQLQLLGAQIHSTLSDQCTHVVFKDGKINTRLHANKLGLTLVNLLWVERCRETESRCDESLYPVTEEKVATPVQLRKTKTRYRSLQPSTDIEKPKKGTRKPKASKQRLGNKDSVAMRTNATDAPLDSGKAKKRLNRKLQWPPDHSDVCSEAELAAHDEICVDIQKSNGKRKLKKSSVFDQPSEISQSSRNVNATDSYVIKEASSCSITSIEEDSQLSAYDASQHFQRIDDSVTNIIKNHNMEENSNNSVDFQDLYSDFEDDLDFCKPKIRCDLTDSQKNVMDNNFYFDEIDADEKPKQAKKKVSKKKKTNSPSKMLTFDSNYNENSDIVTELDADATQKDEITALKHIKSPTIVNTKQKHIIDIHRDNESSDDASGAPIVYKRSDPKQIRFANVLTDVYIQKKGKRNFLRSICVEEVPVREDVCMLLPLNTVSAEDKKAHKLPIAENKFGYHPRKVIKAPKSSKSDQPSCETEPSENINDNATVINSSRADDFCEELDVSEDKTEKSKIRSKSNSKEKNISERRKSEKKKLSHDTLDNQNDLTSVEDQVNLHLLQEPMITSTSDTKQTINENKPSRRVSKRIRHNSAKLSNPDFIYEKSSVKEVQTEEASKSKSPVIKDDSNRPSTPASHSVINESNTSLLNPSITNCRKSGRIRRSNPRYFFVDAPQSTAVPIDSLDTNKPFLRRSTRLDLEEKNDEQKCHQSSEIKIESIDTKSTRKDESDECTRLKRHSKNHTNKGSGSPRILSPLQPKITSTIEETNNKQKSYQSSEIESELIETKSIRKNENGEPTKLKRNSRNNTKKGLSSSRILSPLQSFTEHDVQDQSTSEYSTTETPVVEKPTRKRGVKPTAATTTDTEESATEDIKPIGRPSSKRKKTKKSMDISQVQDNKLPETSPQKRVICTTCCHRDDQAMVRTTVKRFSGSIAESVNQDTTHVVMGNPRRTINLLKGIIHGAYILSLRWVTDSISKDCWEEESNYQLITEFPILKMKGENRKKSATSLFTDTGLMFVEKETTPPQADLTQLIEICGGKVTRSRTRSRYCIGGAAYHKDHVSLSEQWVLDSISQLRLQDANKYLLFPYRSPSPEF